MPLMRAWISLERGGWWLVGDLDELELPSLSYAYAQTSVQSGTDTVLELAAITQQLGSQLVQVRADGLADDTVYEGQAFDESPLCATEQTLLIASPSRVNSDEAATYLANLWVRANACHRSYWRASGSMRGGMTGAKVDIGTQGLALPTMGTLSSYCLSAQIVGIEPDSDSVSYHHQTMVTRWLTQYAVPDYGISIASRSGVWVTAQLLDAALPYCPYPSHLSLASYDYHGLTQARTGLEAQPSYDSQVSTDGLHAVMVTPVWAGMSAGDNTTPPLRSVQLSSGSTHGWQFAPRLGQSVLLSHWYGDVDSPVITRSVYDGIGMGDVDEADVTYMAGGLPHRYNLQGGSSPRWHGGARGASQVAEDDHHAGWVSGISQFGLTTDSETTLLFDDTPNKVGLQWSVNTGGRANALSPTSSSKGVFAPNEHVLELGVLRHRFANHQSTDSGDCFRVASDKALQVLGDAGVLLSTFGIRHSQASHESAWVNDAGQRQLNLSHELSSTLSEAKVAHLQSSQKVDETLQAFEKTAQVMDESLGAEVLGAADVMLVSRDSVLASGGNTLWSAKMMVRQSGGTQSDVVAGDYSLLADKIESLSGVGGSAVKSGLHVSANREALAVQAQGGELQLNSQQSMMIGSESGAVHVTSPERIKLQTSGGASITIDSSGVKLVAPGTIKVRAVKKSLLGGAKIFAPVISLPTSGLFSKAFDLKKLISEELLDQNIKYKLINHTKGTEFEGTLDEEGQTARVFGDKEEKVELVVLGNINHKGEIRVIDISDQIECSEASIEDLFEDVNDSC